MRFTILGHPVRFAWRKMSNAWGKCHPKEPGKTQLLEFDPRAKNRKELETYIHEMLHVGDWHKDENEWVKPLARDMARVLWTLGYRKGD